MPGPGSGGGSGCPAATLADLHQVIQVLFGWDGDHLHLFRRARRSTQTSSRAWSDRGRAGSADPRRPTPGAKVGYTYDFGADWEHEITLEQTIPRDPGQDYPVCVEWRGDSPVEYWSEDDPEEPEPFNLAEVNRQLAALGGSED